MKLLKKLKGGFAAIANTAAKVDRSKGSRFLVFCDIIYCRLRFHVRLNEYLEYRFYDYKDRYRKNFILIHDQVHKYKLVNNLYFTQSKYSVFKKIPDLFHREVILAPTCGENVFLDFVKKHNTVVIKPNIGSYGRNIKILKYENDEQVLQHFREIKNDTVCEKYIHQHKTLNELNPFSVNSLRIVSLRHDEHNIEIVSATLKTGGQAGSFIDNMHGGGIGAQVDIETGIVSTFGFDYSGNRYARHPISGAQFIGINIPNWSKAISLVKEAHSRVDESRIIGWDVAITEDGADIIEANSAPGPRLMQVMDGVPKGESILKVFKDKKNWIHN